MFGFTYFINYDPSPLARTMYLLHCFKVDDPGTYNFGLIGDFVFHKSGPGFVISNFRINGQF